MQERSDVLAFRYGAIIGAVNGVLGLTFVVVNTLVKHDPGVMLVGCVTFIASFALFVEAGHITAKQTGTVGSGVLAGATAGFLMGVGMSIPSLIQDIRSGTLHSLGQVGTILGVFTMLFFGALFAGIGASLGALGSLVGQASFRRARSRGVD